jgi:hypothetical protein
MIYDNDTVESAGVLAIFFIAPLETEPKYKPIKLPNKEKAKIFCRNTFSFLGNIHLVTMWTSLLLRNVAEVYY